MSIRTFLVDDRPETIEVMQVMYSLNPEVEIVGTANTVQEARNFLQGRTVDIVSIDINIHDDNGLDLCSEIRKSYPEVFITMCSLEADSYMQQLATNAGANFFLAKPLTSDDLEKMINFYKEKNKLFKDSDWIDELLENIEDE